MLAVVSPVLHKKGLPPLTVNVVDCPSQMVVEVPVTEAVGGVVTFTVTVCVETHPAAEVPVTVYVVFEVGFTVIAAVVGPVFHEYELAPKAVKVVDAPEQIVVVPVTLTVGNAFTVMVVVAVAEHPAAEVTVTVYVPAAPAVALGIVGF